MIHYITITIPIDPSQYEGVPDTLEGAKQLAVEMLCGAAKVPWDTSTITVGPSPEPFLHTMSACINAWLDGPKHEEFAALKRNSQLLLANLSINRQQTTEAKEV